MKDKDFEDLLNRKLKPTDIKEIKESKESKEIKINNTNKKNMNRNAQSRLRSTEKSFLEEKNENVNKKFSRALSSSFKFFQVNNKIKKENDKLLNIIERKGTVGKSAVKKK